MQNAECRVRNRCLGDFVIASQRRSNLRILSDCNLHVGRLLCLFTPRNDILRVIHAVVLAVIFILFISGSSSSAEKNDFQFRKQPELQQIKPPKPVKINLHRTAKGEYTWDLTGDNVDEIANADRKLRKLLKLE